MVHPRLLYLYSKYYYVLLGSSGWQPAQDALGQEGTDGDKAVQQFEPQAYDIRSFCAAYSVSRSFAYLEIKAGRLKPLKAGRRTLIPRQAAEDWLNALNSGLGKAPAQARPSSPEPPGNPPKVSDRQ